MRIEHTKKECEARGAKLERLSALRSQPVWYRLTVSRASVEFSVSPRVSPHTWKWNYDGWIVEPVSSFKQSRLSKEAYRSLALSRNDLMMHLIEVLKDEEAMRRDLLELFARQIISAQRGVKRAESELEYAEYNLERFVNR
tara:strand:+ start:950 stop:1372 length:423 start_codon:yes stop_codon:yes gene_type:complete